MARTPETERRRATVLFTDITGFTALNERLDPEEAYEIVSACLLRLDGVARKHGGNVDKYLGDCILAVFGVPDALEDAPRAALNAAIEMHEAVEAFNGERGISPPLRVHTGINTGLLISGEISGPIIREFSVMGDTVNVAARLKDKAPPDQIWVGPETFEATDGLFDFRALEAMELKGKQRRIPVYELVSREVHLHRPERAARARVRAPLVGRSAEIAALGRTVEGLERGRGGAVAVIGEAGIGKSRLVDELRGRCTGRGFTWLLGRSVSIGSQLPFDPLVDLFQRWAGVRGSDAPELAERKLRSAVSEVARSESEEIFPLLATLLGLELRGPGVDRLAGLEGQAMERILLGATARILALIAHEAPAVVVFEDLHWADRSTLQLVEGLVRRLADAPILFVLVARPHHAPLNETFRRISDSTRLETFALRPLERDATQEMLDHFAGGGELAAQLRERIEDRAAGNPFFVEEIVRALLESGGLERRDGGLWTTDRTAGIELPATVTDLLAIRLDRLDPDSRAVIEAASVVGRTFRRAILLEIVGAERARAALTRLVDADLLESRDRGDEIRYAFKHPLIQETAYEIMARARRRELHGRVAEAIEGVIEPGLPGRSGMLAYHYGLAGDTRRAERFLFQAGDEAARVAASSEALHFFQDAYRLYLENAGEDADRGTLAALEQKIARAYFNRGELPQASEHFGAALEHLGVREARGRLRLTLSLARTLVVVLARLYGGRWLEGRRAATDRDREIISIMFDRARAQTTGDPARFLHDSLATVRKVGSVDPATVPGAGGILSAASGSFSFGGLSFSIGERFVQRAADLIDPDDLREVFLYRVMRFAHRFLLGDWSDAIEIEPGEVDAALRLGQLWDATTYLGLLADKRIFQARFDRGQETLERIAKIEAHYLYDLATSNRQFVTMLDHLEREDLAEAERQAEAYERENDEAILRILSLGYLAKVRCLRGDLAGAREALKRGDRAVAEAGMVPPFQLGALATARALAELETLHREDGSRAQRRRARDAVRRASRLARKVAWHRPEARRMEGILFALRGKTHAASRAFGRALDEAEALDMPLETARSWDAISEHLGEARFRGRDAEAGRAEAERIRSEVFAARP